ncbi:aromatic motif membrane protein [Mycoplasmopsis gallinacea]|uniref:Lipoprotein n=1 Tax=Mycoplasmopsis gallinacea TaxID=29556 RepID=A0A6H0V229_9BACT|nr:aromatic motif membrane protein [Mycoplasmopsis gallinacea]QIW62028.1 hypothetical protein GOQ20_00905 [Mycoplasmopsis gallinacea]
MKKWLLNSLGTSIVLPAFLAFSCQKNVTNTKKSITLKKVDTFQNNKSINFLLNKFFSNNEKEISTFLNNQNNINNSKFDELKYALLWFEPFRSISNEKAGGFASLVDASRKILVNNLDKNWFWFLKNIKNSSFIFNPYGSYYSAFSNEQNDFEYIQEKFPSLSLNLESNEIIDHLVVDIPQSAYDVYDQKQAIYLIYSSNFAIKFYNWNNTEKLLIPDVYYLPDAQNIEQTKEILTTFENQIWSEYNQWIIDEIEYQKGYNDPSYDPENTKQKFNDKHLLTQFNRVAYSYMSKIAINNLNANQKQIYKFTWKDINENS